MSAPDGEMSTAVDSVLVEPVPKLLGHVAVPGDKSISHRSVLIGAICDGETRIAGFGRSADTEATISAVRALGVEVYEHGADTLRVFGKGLYGLRAPAGAIDCANAGTLVRLIAGILAGQAGETFELRGDDSLSRRPMTRISDPGDLQRLRIHISDRPGVLAGIFQALGAERINVEDFELDHVSTERGGTLTMLVTGAGEAERARDLLEGQGYGVVVAPVIDE